MPSPSACQQARECVRRREGWKAGEKVGRVRARGDTMERRRGFSHEKFLCKSVNTILLLFKEHHYLTHCAHLVCPEIATRGPNYCISKEYHKRPKIAHLSTDLARGGKKVASALS